MIVKNMSVTLRKYNVTEDYKSVSDFLIENYQPGNRDGNFLQPAWEYMHSHPELDEKSLDKIGIWEDSGRIAGVAHYESYLGEAFFEVCQGYEYLKPEMLEYAEKNLYAKTQDGKRFIHVYINDFDTDFEDLVKSRGYEKNDTNARPMTKLPIILSSLPETSLPDGFIMTSLADDNNLEQLNRVLWRGFNHGDEPTHIDYEGKGKMQSVPNYRKELNIIISAPDGNYVSYSGTWFNAANKYAYVEPVCTDPDYRRMGLARTASFEGIRRCGELGAEVAYVGSVLPLYQSMGFKKLFTCNCWTKYLDMP
ncbi:GNAT family N-acetyltransferase [Chloroflexota bacterium]